MKTINRENQIRPGRWIAGAALALLTGQTLLAGETTIIGGFDYSSGNYGETERTDMLYLPLTIKYRSFPWTAKVTLPYISITGPASVTAGGNGVLVDNSNGSARETDSGLGDVTASLGFALDSLWEASGNTFVDITTRVKLPTADADARLGTGETDYQLQLDIAQAIGNSTPFVALGYRWIGDTDITDYNDVLYSSLGIDQKLTDTMGVGFSYDFMQATKDDADDRQELMGYIHWKVNQKISLNLYGVAGFTDASPDQAVGVQFVVK